MFDHSRATPLPSLFTSWGLTNWLFQIWFSSASTTGFKLKFQQVIGYRALPSQPQTTKRADPISKRIYVGLFVAKLLETLASKGTSRGKGLNPARTATAPKMIKLFLQALPFLSHPPRKQAGSTSRNTPLRHRFCLRYFVPGEVLLQELQTKAKMPSPQASVWIHSSWNKRLLPNWWWKICSKKRASNLFCTHDDRIQRLDLPSSIRRVERAVFSWRVVQFFNLPKAMARQAAADQACTQLIRRANPNCMHITTAWGQFRSATPDTRWGGRLRCDVLFTFGIKFALRPWWQDPQAGPSNAGQVLQCGEFAERWIAWNLTVARLPRHYKQ